MVKRYTGSAIALLVVMGLLAGCGAKTTEVTSNAVSVTGANTVSNSSGNTATSNSDNATNSASADSNSSQPSIDGKPIASYTGTPKSVGTAGTVVFKGSEENPVQLPVVGATTVKQFIGTSKISDQTTGNAIEETQFGVFNKGGQSLILVGFEVWNNGDKDITINQLQKSQSPDFYLEIDPTHAPDLFKKVSPFFSTVAVFSDPDTTLKVWGVKVTDQPVTVPAHGHAYFSVGVPLQCTWTQDQLAGQNNHFFMWKETALNSGMEVNLT